MSIESKCSGLWQPKTAITNPLGLKGPMSRTVKQYMTPQSTTFPIDDRNRPRWYYVDLSKWLIHGPYSQGLATSLRAGSYIEDSRVRTN